MTAASGTRRRRPAQALVEMRNINVAFGGVHAVGT